MIRRTKTITGGKKVLPRRWTKMSWTVGVNGILYDTDEEE